MNKQEAYDLYDSYLDELGLNNLISQSASIVLVDFDPIMYDCGFNDWLDGQDIELED